MPSFSPARSEPITLSASTEAHVYLLFALAMGLTVVGVFLGDLYAQSLFTSGTHFLLLMLELAIIFTAGWWMEKSPWNYLLFGAFPVISGVTLAPFLLYVAGAYSNGISILLNALAATTFMSAAAAVTARFSGWDLSWLGRALFFGILGLLGFGLLQLFFPALRGSQWEFMLSAAGVVIFALFTAFDIQRISRVSRLGGNPFLLALSLYLDIFNLFIYMVRLMVALSGDRR